MVTSHYCQTRLEFSRLGVFAFESVSFSVSGNRDLPQRRETKATVRLQGAIHSGLTVRQVPPTDPLFVEW